MAAPFAGDKVLRKVAGIPDYWGSSSKKKRRKGKHVHKHKFDAKTHAK